MMFNKILKRPFLMCLSVAFLLNMLIEFFGRKAPLSFFEHIVTHPQAFLFNWVFITLTLSLCLFFKRKYFVLSIVVVIWLALGFINAYVLTYRTNPLCAIDFFILQISWNFIGIYVNWIQLILIAAATALAVLLLVLLFRKSPRSEIKIKPALTECAVLIVLSFTLMTNFLGLGVNAGELKDLRESYKDYGFVYCFFRGSVERGIDEPDNYTDKGGIESLKAELSEIPEESPAVKPNIIFVQLESFFDVNLLTDVDFSENPVPNFTKLKSDYSHGKLSVPTVGAGTANTEFEIISQMDLDFFGTGEYPYKTVLKKECCETTPFDLKELGYKTFAVHNNNATFYDRNTVFSTLGFDDFLTIEYMNELTYNPEGWCKDICLVPQIEKCLDSTESTDYIYTISVQGHGAYPKDAEDNGHIKITRSDKDDEGVNSQIEYYVNQIHESDEFIKALTDEMSQRNEPTVIVFYGDHMPSLDIDSDELFFGDLFETEYVIWDNMGLKAETKDTEAYQLSAYVLGKLGINSGNITKIHQNMQDDSDYLDKLQNVEYDILYGDKHLYNEQELYTPTEIQMGIDPIDIKSVSYTKSLIVKGDNFTKYSYICINGQKLDTLMLSSKTLKADECELKDGDAITVAQISDDAAVLSETEPYIYREKGN